MKIKNKGGYVVPVAIGILLVASLGLLLASWWGKEQKTNTPEKITGVVVSPAANNVSVQLSANDDATLDADSANIDAQIKALDNGSTDINNSLNDSSSI